jgi:hypothetical protein
LVAIGTHQFRSSLGKNIARSLEAAERPYTVRHSEADLAIWPYLPSNMLREMKISLPIRIPSPLRPA